MADDEFEVMEPDLPGEGYDEAPVVDDAPEPPAEAAAEAPQAEEQAEAAPEQQEAEKPATVPSWRMREETEKRRATEAKLAEMESKWQNLENRFAMAQRQPQPEQPAGPPDPEEDIFGAVKYTNEQLAKLQESQALNAQQEAQRQQFIQFSQRVANDAAQFRAEQADFDQAYQFHRQVKANEYQRMGMPAHMVAQKLEADEIALSQAAYQQGRNPAAVTYELAQYYGWDKYRDAAQQQQTQQAQPSEAEQKLDRIAAAQDNNQSLTQAGGSPTGGELSLETINGMSESEFQAWYDKPGNAAKLDALIGG